MKNKELQKSLYIQQIVCAKNHMAPNLEQRLILPGSRVFDQPIFKEVFESMREFLHKVHPPLEEITDEQLFRLLLCSKGMYGRLSEYIKRHKVNLGIDYGLIQPIYNYIQQVFDNQPNLKAYLDSLPATLKEGVVSYGIRNLVLTYESFVKNVHQRPSPSIQPEDSGVQAPDLSQYITIRPKPRE